MQDNAALPCWHPCLFVCGVAATFLQMERASVATRVLGHLGTMGIVQAWVSSGHAAAPTDPATAIPLERMATEESFKCTK